MAWVLGSFAGILFILYAVYFIRIVRGKPEEFEMELMQALAAWMVARGTRAKGRMWLMFALSALLELTYFVLVFEVIQNTFILIFTSFFAGYEVLHLLIVSLGLARFFRGELKLKDIFRWKAERFSAILFYTHSMLVLVTLIFYK